MKEKRKQKYLQWFLGVMILSATIFCKDASVSAQEIQSSVADINIGEESSTKAQKEEHFVENGINYVAKEDGTIEDEIQKLIYTYDEWNDVYIVTGCWTNKPTVVIADTLRGKKVTGIESLPGDTIETVTIGKHVKTISKRAFYEHENLKTVVLSDALTSIGEEAFAKSGLTSIVITKNVSSIGKNAFSECKNLMHVELKSKKLTTIPEYCFSDAKALKEITLPSKITKLGSSAFSGCSSLEKVVFKGKIKAIPSNCFSGTTSLKSISFPKSLKEIGDFAFSNSGLESLVIPSTVTSLGSYIVYECKSLTTLTVNANLKKTGIGFSSCTGLKQLNIAGKIDTVSIYECPSLEKIKISGTLNTIESNTFAKLPSLKEVNISGTVRVIENDAFVNLPSLEEVNISGTVREIKSNAFGGCKNLKKISFSKNVKKINDFAFKNADSYFTVSAPENSCAYNYFKERSIGFLVTDSEKMGFNLYTGFMITGETKNIIASNYPGTLKWKSSNSSVIKISSAGKATAKKAGSATLTATCGEQKFTFKMKVLSRTKENVMRVIYSEYVRPEMSDYEKVVAANRWLVENVKYDYENYLNDTIPWESYTADGAFVKGIAVCNGYTLAFKEIMDYYEIPCRKVMSQTMFHDWNAVKIKDHWYHVDVTWNDPVLANSSNENREVYTDNLLLTDKEFKGHYDYDFNCTTSEKSKIDKKYRTKSAAANKKVEEKSPLVPYLNAFKKDMAVGGKTFVLTLSGAKAKTFSSSNKKVATVSAKGVIKAKKAGTTVIKVKASDGKTYSCKVTVENPKLNKAKLSLDTGKSAALKVVNTKQKVQWSTSNSKVAAVSEKGKVKAVGNGTAKVTAEVNGKKMTCTVHVHSYKEKVTKAAVCTDDGIHTYTCSCGKTYTEIAEALGHNYQWIVTKKESQTVAETVSDFGKRELKCEHCNHVKVTQDIINMGTKILYGHFDKGKANELLIQVNEYRRIDNEEGRGDGIHELEALKESAGLESELKVILAKCIVDIAYKYEWSDRGDVIYSQPWHDVNDVEEVWGLSFTRKGIFVSYKSKEIGTCCFRYDSDGDGEMNKVYWGILIDQR